MMKKTFLFVLIAFMTGVSFISLQAQTYRIEAGYLQPTRYSNNIGTQLQHGVRLGGTVDFAIPKADFLSIHTGLLYSFTFGKSSQKYYFSSTSDSIRVNNKQGHYIDIPLHIVASYRLFKDKITVFAFAGPNFNIGLYQQQDVQTTVTDGQGLKYIKDELGYHIGTRNLYPERLSRFNFQLEAGGGLQWWKLQVKGGYSFGINNISKFSNSREHQRGWYVSTSYEF